MIPPARLPQLLAAVAANLGAFSVGCIMGYSSPAGIQLANITTTTEDCPLLGDGDVLTKVDLSWFSSMINIGAMIGAVGGGPAINILGRRGTMLATGVPFLLGWILIGAATNVAMLVSGRFFCGICCGLVSVCVPTYLGEISSPDIRGKLGAMYQLMATVGVLYTYTVGVGLCWQWLALTSLLPAVVFVVWMALNKESPTYLSAVDKPDQAREALQHFRGKDYNIGQELELIQESVKQSRERKVSLSVFRQKHVLRPFLISMSLMFFQQCSGVNAFLFNLTTIFEEAKVSLSPAVSSVVVAAVQSIGTGVGAVLMDRAGRKVLLAVSAGVMTITLVVMGTYFYLSEQGKISPSLSWIPVVNLMVFIGFFSIGYGPIPWLMMGELFTAEVKEVAGSMAALFNWGMSFVITVMFSPMQNALNNSGVYWLFAGVCAVNFVFVLVVVQETKGKTIEQITAMFGGPEVGEKGNEEVTLTEGSAGKEKNADGEL